MTKTNTAPALPVIPPAAVIPENAVRSAVFEENGVSVWAAAYQLDTEFFESRGPNTRAFCRSVCAVSISFEGEEAISPAFPVDFRFFEDGSFTYFLYEVDGFNPREFFDDTYEQWDLFGCSIDHLIYGALRDLAKKLPAYRAVSLSFYVPFYGVNYVMTGDASGMLEEEHAAAFDWFDSTFDAPGFEVIASKVESVHRDAPEGVPVAFGSPSERGAVVLFVVRHKAAESAAESEEETDRIAA